MEEKLKVKKETIARTVVLIFALVNQFLTLTGYNPLPFAESDVYAVATGIITVLASLWAWWKDNNFTQKALAKAEKDV